MDAKKGMRNIWFFVGWILFIIGLVELTAGIYSLLSSSYRDIRLAHLHANIWWGILIMFSGLLYLLKNKNEYIDV